MLNKQDIEDARINKIKEMSKDISIFQSGVNNDTEIFYDVVTEVLQDKALNNLHDSIISESYKLIPIRIALEGKNSIYTKAIIEYLSKHGGKHISDFKLNIDELCWITYYGKDKIINKYRQKTMIINLPQLLQLMKNNGININIETLNEDGNELLKANFSIELPIMDDIVKKTLVPNH